MKKIISDITTCMYYARIDPFTKKPVKIARNLRDRKLLQALMQFSTPENPVEVGRYWAGPVGST